MTSDLGPGAAGALALPSGPAVAAGAAASCPPAAAAVRAVPPARHAAGSLGARWVRWQDFSLPSDPAAASGALHEAWDRSAGERVETARPAGAGEREQRWPASPFWTGCPAARRSPTPPSLRSAFGGDSLAAALRNRLPLDPATLAGGWGGLSGIADRVLGRGDDVGLAW